MTAVSSNLQPGDLLGSWRLQKCQGRSDDGGILFPYGEEPQGMLTYSGDGTMMVVLMNPDRPHVGGGDPYLGTEEEVRAAFNGFNAYCGRYSLNAEAGTVTHHLEQALYPHWVGSDQLRYVVLRDGILELTTPPLRARNRMQTFFLVWSR